MALEVKITQAQEVSPGLTLVSYSASTGETWNVYEPGLIGGRGTPRSTAFGRALVGTTGSALMQGAEVPRGSTSEELRAAIAEAEWARRSS